MWRSCGCLAFLSHEGRSRAETPASGPSACSAVGSQAASAARKLQGGDGGGGSSASAGRDIAGDEAVQSRRCASDVASELAAQILQESGNLPEDSGLLLGRGAALLSGASLGLDACFGEAALSAGHLVVNWLPQGARASRRVQDLDGGRSLCVLKPEVLGDERVMAALNHAALLRGGAENFEFLCRRQPSYAQREQDLRRCFFQVARATAVYIVAPRLAKAEDAGLPALDLGGNAGWAAQMYVNRFSPAGQESATLCRLFLFENPDRSDPSHRFDPATAYKWHYWQLPNGRNGLVEGCWLPFGTDVPVLQRHAATAWKFGAKPPGPEGFYAVLGPKELSWSCTRHEEALADVYAALPAGGDGKAIRGEGKGKGKGQGKGKGKGKKQEEPKGEGKRDGQLME